METAPWAGLGRPGRIPLLWQPRWRRKCLGGAGPAPPRPVPPPPPPPPPSEDGGRRRSSRAAGRGRVCGGRWQPEGPAAPERQRPPAQRPGLAGEGVEMGVPLPRRGGAELPVGAAPPQPGSAGPAGRGCCRLFFRFFPSLKAGKGGTPLNSSGHVGKRWSVSPCGAQLGRDLDGLSRRFNSWVLTVLEVILAPLCFLIDYLGGASFPSP